MKEFSYYQQRPAYPIKPKRPDLAYNATSTEIRIHADKVAQYEVAMQKYEAERDIYKQCESELLLEFKNDAIDEVGLKGHEASERAYSYAWEQGHSCGLQDVYTILVEIAYVLTGK